MYSSFILCWGLKHDICIHGWGGCWIPWPIILPLILTKQNSNWTWNSPQMLDWLLAHPRDPLVYAHPTPTRTPELKPCKAMCSFFMSVLNIWIQVHIHLSSKHSQQWSQPPRQLFLISKGIFLFITSFPQFSAFGCHSLSLSCYGSIVWLLTVNLSRTIKYIALIKKILTQEDCQKKTYNAESVLKGWPSHWKL